MAEEKKFDKNAKCKHGHRSAMSNSAWCDLNKICTVLKLRDMCHNPKCICQKQITFTPKQYMLEGAGFKNALKKNFERFQFAWNKFLKPALNNASPYNGLPVNAKTKNLKVGQATTNILNSITGGKIVSPTDLHGNALRLKVM